MKVHLQALFSPFFVLRPRLAVRIPADSPNASRVQPKRSRRTRTYRGYGVLRTVSQAGPQPSRLILGLRSSGLGDERNHRLDHLSTGHEDRVVVVGTRDNEKLLRPRSRSE